MPIIREAQQFIGMLEDGDFAREVGDELRGTISDLADHAGSKGKAKGSVTLTLGLTVEGGSVTIHAEVKSKRPKTSRAATVLFVAEDGNVSTEHPRQMTMFPRPARTADAAEIA